MTVSEALAFVERHGVVLVSAKGPAPRLTEAIVGGSISGSWWGHPKGRHVYSVLQALAESPDILVCRLVGGKVTFVHRRIWPALVRLAERLPPDHVAQVRERHTSSGRHATTQIAFPHWVPGDVSARAKAMSDDDARRSLGAAIDPSCLPGDR